MKKILSLGVALLLLAACGKSNEVADISTDWTGNAVKVEALADPKAKGVTCFISYFDRSLIDRMRNGNVFLDPSDSAIACRQTGPLEIDASVKKGPEEIFREGTSLIWRSIRVTRVWDEGSQSLVYVAHSKKVIEGSAKMSFSAVATYNAGQVKWVGNP